MQSDFKLMPFQVEGVARLKTYGANAWLFDDMGLGKTVQALKLIDDWWYDLVHPLIVCPASLKFHWAKEAADKFGMKSDILGSRSPMSFGWRPRPHRLTIINYDILKDWWEWMVALEPEIIVFDECHYLSNRTSKRTKAAFKIARKAPHVIGISGTAMVNRPAELWPILHMVKPKEFDEFFPYAVRYCSPRKVYGKWDFSGAKRLKELHGRLLHHGMIRRRKKDVIKDLPDKMTTVIEVDISNREDYRNAEKDFLNWLAYTNPDRLQGAAKATGLQLANELRRLAGRGKLKAAREWIDTFLAETTTRKLIVFGVHKKVVRVLQEHYGDKVSVRVDGSITGKKREAAWDRFNTEDECRLLFGNIKAAGVGKSAKKCSTVLFVELGWNPGDHSQAADRVHGLGRGEGKKKVNIFYLIGRDTIEVRTCKLLQRKQHDVDSVMDGAKVHRHMDLFTELCRHQRRLLLA